MGATRRPLDGRSRARNTFVAFEALASRYHLAGGRPRPGDLRLYGWVFSAFLLASVIGIVMAGTLADRVPPAADARRSCPVRSRPCLSAGPRRTCWFSWRAGRRRAWAPGCARSCLWCDLPGAIPRSAYRACSLSFPPHGVVPGLIGASSPPWWPRQLAGGGYSCGLLPLVIAAEAGVVLALRHVLPPASPGPATVPYLAVLGVVAGPQTVLASPVPAPCPLPRPHGCRAMEPFWLSRCAV